MEASRDQVAVLVYAISYPVLQTDSRFAASWTADPEGIAPAPESAPVAMPMRTFRPSTGDEGLIALKGVWGVFGVHMKAAGLSARIGQQMRETNIMF